MPRSREGYNPLLKTYPDSDKINAIDEGAEVLYVRLIAASDDAGHYYGDTQWILARLFTARMVAGTLAATEIDRRVKEICRVGLARLYTVDGVQYIELIDCFKTFRKDVKRDIRFPETDNQTDMRDEDVTNAARMRPEPVTNTARQTRQDKTRPESDCQGLTDPDLSDIFKKLKKPRWGQSDLKNTQKLISLHRSLTESAPKLYGHADLENIIAAAENVLQQASRGKPIQNQCGLFFHLVENRKWQEVDGQRNKAKQRLADYQRSIPARTGPAAQLAANFSGREASPTEP